MFESHLSQVTTTIEPKHMTEIKNNESGNIPERI